MIRPLNGGGPAAGRETVPAGLSKQILAEARQVEEPEQCGRLEELARRLRGVDPAAIEGDGARLAFWINLYNALLLHRLCLQPIRGSVLWQLRLFSTVAYEVGGDRGAAGACHPRLPARRDRGRRRARPRRPAAPDAALPGRLRRPRRPARAGGPSRFRGEEVSRGPWSGTRGPLRPLRLDGGAVRSATGSLSTGGTEIAPASVS